MIAFTLFGSIMLLMSVFALGMALERKQWFYATAFLAYSLFWGYLMVFVPAGWPPLHQVLGV